PDLSAVATDPASLGILAGLVLGKPIGIVLLSWVAVRLNLAELPRGVSWPAILGAGCLAGMGFTMSIFIAGLAFGSDAELLDTAKLAILGASAIAGALGSLVLFFAPARRDSPATAG
ncbi:MAG: Na+/H+ antiporter NhaA, partial [Candidatus Eisenbacteria bacterium]|nr:Na+/H+ antiporter NhaA [Candidatus Eisenbacteria bacterium]